MGAWFLCVLLQPVTRCLLQTTRPLNQSSFVAGQWPLRSRFVKHHHFSWRQWMLPGNDKYDVIVMAFLIRQKEWWYHNCRCNPVVYINGKNNRPNGLISVTAWKFKKKWKMYKPETANNLRKSDIIKSPREVMFLPLCICLSAVRRITEVVCRRILVKFLEKLADHDEQQLITFWWWSGSCCSSRNF